MVEEAATNEDVAQVEETEEEAQPKPAEFNTEALVISPTEVTKGRSSTVTVDVTNIGEIEGDYQVTLRVNDEIAETKKVTLAAGATETVSFTLLEEEPGTYVVNVDGLSGTLVVKARPIVTPTPTPPPTPTGPYTGPLFDTHLHMRNILPQSPETLLSYLDREKVDWAIGFCAYNRADPMPIIRSIGSRVVTLLRAMPGEYSEAELRQYLQPRGPCWGAGEIGLWRPEYQSITFDSPLMQTIF
ncbi:CARDB domain-containing protein [Chloroflexota bacterium]